MPALTPSFLFDLETNMRVVSIKHYQRLTQPGNLWHSHIMKTVPSQSRKERISWLLETAKIERPNAKHGGGQAIFEDMVMQTVEYENENAVAGLELKKEKLEDLDGGGVKLATEWSAQIGAYAAYWPQKELAAAILANPVTYDTLSFFNTAHPVNPFDSGIGTYRNDFTGAASGIYPGALPIDASVTLDVAIGNLAKAIAYVASLKMANGVSPRFLKPTKLFVPPALVARAQQMTNAKFIAQAGTGGAGSADVESVIRNFGMGQPIEVTELGSAFGGSDTTWYLGVDDLMSDELGAFMYIDREPFSVIYHNEMTDAEVARKRVYQWTTEGRNVVAPGHPYLLFRCRAA